MNNADKPAFARSGFEHTNLADNARYYPEEGLTKREYFAAMAMQGILGFSHEQNVPNKPNVEYCAKMAVVAADELLKQLES